MVPPPPTPGYGNEDDPKEGGQAWEEDPQIFVFSILANESLEPCPFPAWGGQKEARGQALSDPALSAESEP